MWVRREEKNKLVVKKRERRESDKDKEESRHSIRL